MSNKIARATSFCNLLATSLFAGMSLADWLAIIPMEMTLPAPEYARVQQQIIRRFDPAMPILGMAAPVAALAFLLQNRGRWKQRGSRKYLLHAAGLACFAAAVAVSVAINVPLNKRILSWDIKSPPADWAQARDQSNFADSARTAASLLALIFYLLSAHSAEPAES